MEDRAHESRNVAKYWNPETKAGSLEPITGGDCQRVYFWVRVMLSLPRLK